MVGVEHLAEPLLRAVQVAAAVVGADPRQDGIEVVVDGETGFVYSGDTGPTTRLWQVAREMRGLKALEYRGKIDGQVCFGVYADVVEPGRVRVGDEVGPA